jgi:hypothetical protein
MSVTPKIFIKNIVIDLINLLEKNMVIFYGNITFIFINVLNLLYIGYIY